MLGIFHLNITISGSLYKIKLELEVAQIHKYKRSCTNQQTAEMGEDSPSEGRSGPLRCICSNTGCNDHISHKGYCGQDDPGCHYRSIVETCSTFKKCTNPLKSLSQMLFLKSNK